MLPTFLIIGAPRAGTTWLARNLREHPQVFLPAEKELHYFDRHYDRGQAYYEQYFDAAQAFDAVGEATPDYLYLPDVPERIHAILPHCKLILSLRNPIDRLYSRYWNSKAKYRENRNLSFEAKLRQKPLFVEEGNYFTHLTRYYRFFSPDQFLIVLYDDIQSRPDEVVQQTYEFLEVDMSFRSPLLDERINSAAEKPRLAKSRSLYYIHKAAGRLGFTGTAKRLSEHNFGELPSMDATTRRWLREVYADENRKLRDLTGIDTSVWD